jgi:tetratricopeptide (TPR) repeat protein
MAHPHPVCKLSASPCKNLQSYCKPMATPPSTSHADNMKTLSRFLVFPLLTLLVAFALTQPPQSAQRKSSQYGQPRDAIDLLLRAESPPLNDTSRDITWHLFSSAYRIMNAYEKARQCYQTATHILKEIPNPQPDYALALDNLGAVEELKTLRTMSKRLYRRICDRYSQVDLKTELASADASRNAEPKKEAARLETDAAPALTNVRARRHGGCATSAESFR